jgi:hypothetical protein
MDCEEGCFYLLICNEGKEYVFKWDGSKWIDSLFGCVPECLTQSMHIAGRLCLSDRGENDD